jgi:hypothetical protein
MGFGNIRLVSATGAWIDETQHTHPLFPACGCPLMPIMSSVVLALHLGELTEAVGVESLHGGREKVRDFFLLG